MNSIKVAHRFVSDLFHRVSSGPTENHPGRSVPTSSEVSRPGHGSSTGGESLAKSRQGSASTNARAMSNKDFDTMLAELIYDRRVDPDPAASSGDRREQGLRDATHRLRETARRYDLKEEVNRLDDRERDADLGLLVLVTGEGNFGKSSLINALAGRPVAPVSIFPKTFKVDVYMSAGDADEHAILRVADAAEGVRMSVNEGLSRCDEEEAAADRASKLGEYYRPSILEAIWCFQGFGMGSDACLVDTPGLAQMLRDDQVLSSSLVRGLGATYSVEEVWALWYHRADVVLWCFQANKFESAETLKTLSTLVGKYRKAIVPVATKADLIPLDRWGELEARFRQLYGSLLGEGGRVPLFLTVCGGRSDLVGRGVKGLRAHLLDLASEARERKWRATEQFLADWSRHVESVLSKGADQVVKNMRTIAVTADDIALEGMRRYREALARMRDRGNDLVRTKEHATTSFLIGLSDDLADHWRRIRKYHQFMGPDSEQKEELSRAAERRIQEFLQVLSLTRDLDGIVAETRDGIGDFARKLAASRRLEATRIDQSGKELKQAIRMSLTLPESELQPVIVLPPPVLSLPNVGGLFWRWIRDMLGRRARRTTLTPEEREFGEAVIDQMRQLVGKLVRQGEEQFTEGVAKPLADAVEQAFADASRTTVAELRVSLGRLDEDIRQLRASANEPDARASTFEVWARYWTSVSPDASLVRRLGVNLMTHRLPQLSSYAARFRTG